MDRTRNTGKVGIVTGAGSGIGRATALPLAVELATATGRQEVTCSQPLAIKGADSPRSPSSLPVMNAQSGSRRRPWLGLVSAMNRRRSRANQAHEHQRLDEPLPSPRPLRRTRESA